MAGLQFKRFTQTLIEGSKKQRKKFPSSAHISSWACLSPRNDESAKKKKSRKVMPGNSYIKSIRCQCAWAASRTRNTHISHWFWSHQGKLGKNKAITAVVRKI
jgi:transposase